MLDFVLCHGSFLNSDNTYDHENKSFRGFGSYGDILVRDRKMYVAPTPFALTDGTAHRNTLILPDTENPGQSFVPVGTLRRREVDKIVTTYNFDLRSNSLEITTAPNPNAGLEHVFVAYRLEGDPLDSVSLRSQKRILENLPASVSCEDE